MQENSSNDNSKPSEDIFENLPPEIRRVAEANPDVAEILMMQRELSIYQGPLPHPDVLKGYAEVDPSFPDRVIGMAENQSLHRQNLENKVIDANIKNERRGSIFAFIICLVISVGALVLLYNGKSLTGMAALITAVGSIVGLFIYGKRMQVKEIEEKDKELMENKEE